MELSSASSVAIIGTRWRGRVANFSAKNHRAAETTRRRGLRLFRSGPKPAVQFGRLRPEVDPKAPGHFENLRE
jgi:hypothetical protein